MDIESWKRRLLIITTDLQVEALEHSEEGLELLKNHEVKVLPISEIDIFNTKFTLLGGIRPQPGMLLLMSPYDDKTYVEVSDAKSFIALEKASLTLRFCQLLGAKSVTVRNIKIVDIENQKELNIDAQKDFISGSLSGKKSDIENIKNQLKVKSTFSGGKPNLEKAEKLLKSSGLISEPFLKHLLEMVIDSKEVDNKLNKITQEISLTQSLQKTFEFISKINLPTAVVGAEFKSITKEKIEIFLSLEINF